METKRKTNKKKEVIHDQKNSTHNNVGNTKPKIYVYNVKKKKRNKFQ